MSQTTQLRTRLSVLDHAELTELLRHRPDVLRPPLPRDLRELAERLWHPISLVSALRAANLAALQLAEAAAALGAGCGRASLVQLLADGGDEARHPTEVDQVIDDLVAAGVLLAQPAEDGAEEILLVPDAFAEIFPRPLDLGRPLSDLLVELPVAALQKIQTKLGLPRQSNRASTLSTLVPYLSDGDAVRTVVANAPRKVAEYLQEYAERGDGVILTAYDPVGYRARQEAVAWAAERGLMFSSHHYSWEAQMPAEVALALRGTGYRAPFTAQPPPLPARDVDRGQVDRGAAAALGQIADHSITVLDHVARVAVSEVKGGGIGARELSRVAKATGIGETEVRLSVEVAARAGLLERTGGTVEVTAAFAEWRDAEPADRLVLLLSAWWALGAAPTRTHDTAGKTLRALRSSQDCSGCLLARTSLIGTLGDVAGAADRASVAARTLWYRPLVHVVEADSDDAFLAHWREAELFGVIALDAVSELGRLLLAEDLEGVHRHVSTVLPSSVDQATFGADLTVFVLGTPSARVSRLLDSAADRESRGGAVMWRFSPASVRRSMDEGTRGDALVGALAEIARNELPQPLRYLIADVARRYGNLRLSTSVSVVRSDDEALLAEVATDRRLRVHRLRLLAPTVLSSDSPVPALLHALRMTGYLPVSDDPGEHAESPSSGRIRRPAPTSNIVEIASRRARGSAPPASEPDAADVAAALMQAPVVPATLTPTEERLAALTRLASAEIRLLAHAVDTQSRVQIDYVSSTGGRTRRVIDQPELSGGSLYAWCELRRDDRIFTAARIESVAPV